MNDVTITKVSGGLARRQPSTDMVSGFIANGVAVVGGVQLDTHYTIISLKEAEDLGIDAAYDESNVVLVYEHIKEMFRINPSLELTFILKSQATTFTQLVDEVAALSEYVNGTVNQVAIARNPTVAIAVGDTTELLAAIANAQTVANNMYLDHKPVHILLEGKGFDITDADDFRALNARKVSVMVGQSNEVASREIAAAFPYAGYGAVGTLLGAVSLAAVHEGVDWVQQFNMLGGNLSIAAISGVQLTDATVTGALLNTANTRGAIFFKTHIGIAGIYFNDTHTCTVVTDDFAYIENQRTINKATRIVRATLLPDLGSPVNVDASGQLDESFVMAMKAKVDKALTEQMQGEVSSFTFYIDPAQNVLSTSEINTQLSIVPVGKARSIKVAIGFTNPF